MSTEENKVLDRRLAEEGFSKGNMAVLDELIATDCVDHSTPPGTPPGREGIKQFFTMLRTAFPDLQYTIEDVIAEGDTVVTRNTWRGTHQGVLMGIAPTGKQVTVTEIDITRWSGGKAVEHWGNQDLLGLMQQLGAIPTPGQAAE
jgi:predicted ester cyclase